MFSGKTSITIDASGSALIHWMTLPKGMLKFNLYKRTIESQQVGFKVKSP